MRYLFSSVFPLFTIDLIDNIGFEWTMTSCAVVMMVLAPVPWLLQKFGPDLRSKSQYARKLPVLSERQGSQKPTGSNNCNAQSTTCSSVWNRRQLQQHYRSVRNGMSGIVNTAHWGRLIILKSMNITAGWVGILILLLPQSKYSNVMLIDSSASAEDPIQFMAKNMYLQGNTLWPKHLHGDLQRHRPASPETEAARCFGTICTSWPIRASFACRTVSASGVIWWLQFHSSWRYSLWRNWIWSDIYRTSFLVKNNVDLSSIAPHSHIGHRGPRDLEYDQDFWGSM